MKLTVIILATLLAVILGGGYFLERTIAPTMDQASARTKLEPYSPQPLTVATRSINLGYARFDIPATIPGEPVQLPKTLGVVLDTGAWSNRFVCLPPMADNARDYVQMADLFVSVSKLTGEKIADSFALRKRAFAVQPFSGWSVPFRGIRRSRADVVLLLVKNLFGHDTPVVQVFETPRLGLFINVGPKRTIITLFDKQKQVTQEFLALPGAIDLDQTVAALLSSYQFTSDETTKDKWLEQLQATGLRVWAKPASAAAVK